MTDPGPEAVRIAADLRLALGRLVRLVRSGSGMPPPRLAVLGLLDREGPTSIAELAARQAVRHQSMARTVSQLVADGLVDQRPHPTDGRKVQLSISPAGRAALEAERERRVDWLAEAIARELTPAERRTLADATTLMARLAGDAPSTGTVPL